MFGLSLTLPPHVGGGGELVCESVGKADLCHIILTASSPVSMLICHSLAIRLLDLPVSCETSTVIEEQTHWVCFLFSLREMLMFWLPVLVYCFIGSFVFVV